MNNTTKFGGSPLASGSVFLAGGGTAGNRLICTCPVPNYCHFSFVCPLFDLSNFSLLAQRVKSSSTTSPPRKRLSFLLLGVRIIMSFCGNQIPLLCKHLKANMAACLQAAAVIDRWPSQIPPAPGYSLPSKDNQGTILRATDPLWMKLSLKILLNQRDRAQTKKEWKKYLRVSENRTYSMRNTLKLCQSSQVLAKSKRLLEINRFCIQTSQPRISQPTLRQCSSLHLWRRM